MPDPEVKPPAITAATYGPRKDRSVTIFWVSWNGATEVDRWDYYARNECGEERPVFLGSKRKTGFETMYQMDLYFDSVWAEAVDAKGAVLEKTSTYDVSLPADWQDKDLPLSAAGTMIGENVSSHGDTGEDSSVKPLEVLGEALLFEALEKSEL